jgi:hypothetical protein
MHKILKFGHLSVFGIFLIFLQTDTPTFIRYVQVEFPFHGGHFEAQQQITPIRISSQSPRESPHLIAAGADGLSRIFNSPGLGEFILDIFYIGGRCSCISTSIR